LNCEAQAIEDGEKTMEDIFMDLLEVLREHEEEYTNKIDFVLRTLKYFLELAEEFKRTKQVNALVPLLLPLLFEVFTQNEIIEKGGRE
jgi:hypothetical protein